MNVSLSQKLSALEKPIRVGIAGAGEFSRALATQIPLIHNMEVVVMADLKPQAAIDIFLAAGHHRSDLELADSVSEASRLISLGKRVVLEDAMIMNQLPIDVVCDVTGDPGFGASFAHDAIENRKHVVVINIEADVVTGPILRRLADQAGVVYTEGDGDQPSLIKGLCDWANLLGLGVFAAGKWTHVKPEPMQRADGKRSDIGYDDGSKNQVEMCCVANMTGLVPDVRGMHMPSIGLTDLIATFDLRQAGGILTRKGVVDVVNCLLPDGKTVIEPLLGGGVFIIVETDNPTARDVILTKGFLHNADGSHALIYRPFHFVGIETPISIARAVLYGEATGAPLPLPVADVMAIAKRDLYPGDRLDGIGGQTVRGVIERFDQAARMRALPLGLAEGVRVNRTIATGTILTYDMLEKEGDSMIWQLRRQQDRFCEAARQQA
jgi:predicted homoserine dehydrogenase-like protein